MTASPRPLHTRALLATLLLCLPVAARAQDERPREIDLGGHQVRVIETDSFEQAVTVDGAELLRDGLIFLDGTVEVAGESVITGVAGSGGNACDGTPFVVSVKDGTAKVDGPVDSCRWFDMTVQPDALVFHTEAYPGLPGEVWTWTPVSGLTEALPAAFEPVEGQSWADFSWLEDKHPSDALGFAPVYTAVLAGMSPQDWQQYTSILVQMGSGKLNAQGYSGDACTKTACLSEWAWLWIDKDSQQAVAFWKGADDEEPKSWPADRDSWPDWIQQAASDAVQGGG